MATQLVKAERSMFPRIYEDLLREFNPDFGPDRWRPLFEWPWENSEDHLGYVLLENNETVVGFAGMIISRQEIEGRPETICNISTWVVKDLYRSAGMSLIMPALLRRDTTITNLTPTAAVTEIFTRLGFKVLEDHDCIILPRPWWLLRKQRGFRVAIGASDVEPLLSEAQRKVLKDHAPLCEHLVVKTPDGGECYLIFTRARRLMAPAARIYHLSDPSVFVEALPTLQTTFLKLGLPLLVCDGRLVEGISIPFSRRVQISHPRLFRSATLRPAQISNTYSELPLLRI